LEVNTAAQFSVGPSVRYNTVARIGKLPSNGASTLTNEPDAVPVAKPFGKAETVSMYCRYSSLDGKSGRVTGVSPLTTVVARVLVVARRAKEGAGGDGDAHVSGGTNAPVARTARAAMNKRERFEAAGDLGMVIIMKLRSVAFPVW
jgi:hypothetical protein